MAKEIQLKASKRSESGKTAVKRLRAAGSVPGIVYGAHAQALNIALNRHDLETALHHATSENVLVSLQVEESGDSGSRLTLIQEVQHHPVTDDILHVDFREVSATETLRTVVPVRAVGEPAGVKEGGVLEYVMRELRVECLPKNLPEAIEVDVTPLIIGQSVHIGDIKPPAGVTLLDDKLQAVFIVAAPIAEEEVAPATEMVEPEVIGEKKEEGEEGAEGEEGKPAAGKAAAGAKAEAGKPAAAGKAEAKPAAGAKADAGKAAPAGKPESKK